MKMAEVVMKSIGLYLLAVMESVVVFLAFMLGNLTNGFISPALAVLIGSLLAATQVLLVFLIKYYFKIIE